MQAPCSPCSCSCLSASSAGADEPPRPERPDDPWMPGTGGAAAAARPLRGSAQSVQVNVDSAGFNILGDAANEPSIAVDPTAPNRIVIGWRQFDTISSDFRQAGYAYSKDGGRSWTFPGVIQPGVFRSDPVLAADAEGHFYYYSLTIRRRIRVRPVRLGRRGHDLGRRHARLRGRQGVDGDRSERRTRAWQHLRLLELLLQLLRPGHLHSIARRRRHVSRAVDDQPQPDLRNDGGGLGWHRVRRRRGAGRLLDVSRVAHQRRDEHAPDPHVRIRRCRSRWIDDVLVRSESRGPARTGVGRRRSLRRPDRGQRLPALLGQPAQFRSAGRAFRAQRRRRRDLERSGDRQHRRPRDPHPPGSGSARCPSRPTGGSTWCGTTPGTTRRRPSPSCTTPSPPTAA